MFNLTRASTHQIYAVLLRTVRAAPTADRVEGDESERDSDRGAISLEQVLWFVAVAVSVGVIATILWNRIFDAADDAELDLPEAPGG